MLYEYIKIECIYYMIYHKISIVKGAVKVQICSFQIIDREDLEKTRILDD